MTGKAKGMKRSGFQCSPGQEEFWVKVTEDGNASCWFHWEEPGVAASGCPACDYGPTHAPDAHHLIPKQRIKSEYARRLWEIPPGVGRQWQDVLPDERDRALSDPRNGIPVCRFHHSQIENHRIYIHRSELPEAVFSFAKDYSLEALLDRAFPERETDAA